MNNINYQTFQSLAWQWLMHGNVAASLHWQNAVGLFVLANSCWWFKDNDDHKQVQLADRIQNATVKSYSLHNTTGSSSGPATICISFDCFLQYNAPPKSWSLAPHKHQPCILQWCIPGRGRLEGVDSDNCNIGWLIILFLWLLEQTAICCNNLASYRKHNQYKQRVLGLSSTSK